MFNLSIRQSIDIAASSAHTHKDATTTLHVSALYV